MKKLIVTLALAAVAAAPAFAATHKKADSARAAYAAVYAPAVTADGRVIGTDPDPNIRYDLLRDQSLLAN